MKINHTKCILLICLFISMINSAGYAVEMDIRGEARIIKETDGYFLINYNQRTEIPENGSLEIISTSYLYLTVEAVDIPPIKSIRVKGNLFIQGDEPNRSLNIGNTNLPDTAIQCGSLEISKNINLSITANEYGIYSENQIEINGGNHVIEMNTSSGNNTAIKSGTYISLKNGSIIHATGTTGLDAGTMLVAEGKDIKLTAIGSEAGISCSGMLITSGAYIQGNESTGDGTYGVLVRGEGNAIVNSGSTLIGKGTDCGILAQGGYIRCQAATVEGTRKDLNDGKTAVYTQEDKIFTIDNGTIREIYEATITNFDESTLLTDYPLLAKNIQHAGHYDWDNTAESQIIGIRKTEQMYPDEKVRMDKSSIHEVVLAATGSSGGEPVKIRVVITYPNSISSTDFVINGIYKIVEYDEDYGTDGELIDMTEIEKCLITIQWPNGQEPTSLEATDGTFYTFINSRLTQGSSVVFQVKAIPYDTKKYVDVSYPAYIVVTDN